MTDFSQWLLNERKNFANAKAENEELRRLLAVLCMRFAEGASVRVPLDIIRRLPDYEFRYLKTDRDIEVYWQRRPDPVIQFVVKEKP